MINVMAKRVKLGDVVFDGSSTMRVISILDNQERIYRVDKKTKKKIFLGFEMPNIRACRLHCGIDLLNSTKFLGKNYITKTQEDFNNE